MTKVSDITKIIEEFAPLDLCFEGDNSGLCLGSLKAEVSAVLLCLDVTIDILKQAVNDKCNLIISHHPAIFCKTKTFLTQSYECDIIKYALENNLNLYSAHSNLDACKGGINERLCDLLGLKILSGQGEFWRIAESANALTLNELQQKVAECLQDKHIKTAGKTQELCKIIAVFCGSGGRDDDFVEILRERNVSALITSEVKVSIVRKLNYYNIKLVEVGHFDSEKCCKNIFMELLCKSGVKVVDSCVEKNPYN